jgi:hypothetical protein
MTPSVYAETAFQSGYNHVCNDADKYVKDRYINSIENGESHHTDEFMNGYHQGFKACADPGAQDTSNFDELPLGQHWGECEERSVGLVCDITNDTTQAS